MQPAKIQRFVNGFRNNFEASKPSKPHKLPTPQPHNPTTPLANCLTVYEAPTYLSDQEVVFLE